MPFRLFLCLCLVCLTARPSAADDAPFLGTDPASVMAAGDSVVQQWLNWSYGHSRESYAAFGAQTEFDYGLTNRIQIAGILTYDWDRTRPSGGPAMHTSLVGLQGELIYRIAAYDGSPIGVALAIDPAFTPASRDIAVRLLLTKYLWGFEHALNINFVNAWEKTDGHWDQAGAVEFNYGLGYAIDRHWTLALEIGNQFSLDRIAAAMDFHDAVSTIYLGPTIQFECDAAVLTAGVQAQLPLASGGNVVNGYRTDAERWRAGLRIARAI